MIKIKIKEHIVLSETKVIEISEKSNLIATIIPRDASITIISKYITSIDSDLNFPAKITINLKERK